MKPIYVNRDFEPIMKVRAKRRAVKEILGAIIFFSGLIITVELLLIINLTK